MIRFWKLKSNKRREKLNKQYLENKNKNCHLWQKNPKMFFTILRRWGFTRNCHLDKRIRRQFFTILEIRKDCFFAILELESGKTIFPNSITLIPVTYCQIQRQTGGKYSGNIWKVTSRSKNVVGKSILVWFIQTFHQLVFTRSRYRVAWIWLGLIRPKHRQSSNGERARSEAATKGERLQRETAQRVHECVAHAWVKLTNFCTTITSSTMRHSMFFGTRFNRGLYTASGYVAKVPKATSLHQTRLH